MKTSSSSLQTSPLLRLLFLTLMTVGALGAAVSAHAEANYVYHERTTADPGCGGQYVTTLNPSSAQTYALRFKAEYQFSNDTARVYYTTDGSTPGGTFGSGNVGTLVVPAAFVCTFGGPVVDVWSATIPAQPAGTVVKYIVSAWHTSGGSEIFANGPGAGCMCGTPTSSSSLATVFQYTVGSTTTLYWDINGATAGAGGATPAGIWSTTVANWSPVFDGTAATGVWNSARNAVFSAGTDASGAFTITTTNAQTAAGLTIEEGTVSLAGNAVSVGAGNVTINSGATLSTDSSLRISATAGATMNVNGATLRTTNPGAAGTFYDTDFTITLGAGMSTFSHVTANILNIVTGPVTGPGSLTKTGVGVLAISGAGTWAGSTIINSGEFRIRTTPDRLPVTTPVTVISPGILNLNSVNQRIGSLSGNGTVGLGSATLIVGDATDTVFTGSISNLANAGAGAVTTGAGRVSKQGSGSLTFTGTNGFTGSLTNNAGTINVAPNSVLFDATADLVVNGGTLNLSNAAQTTLSLSGSGGTVNLGPGHTLTVNNGTAKTYSGVIASSGALTKTGAGTFTLSGPNTYDGNTLVSAGKIAVGSATALGSTAGYTEVASGAEILFTGAGTTFTCAEPFRIAGVGAGDNGAIAVTASATPTLSGPVTLTGDAFVTVSGVSTLTFNNAAAFTSLANQNLTLQGGSGVGGGGTISGVIALGTGGLTKLQGGTWTLSGANTYSGPTTIGAGTLRVANTTGSATGSGDVTVASGATLSGPGIIAGSVSVTGTISAGTSPGTITTGSETWNGGGSYLWEINDATGTAGADPGWDLININGSLTINANSGNKFNINVTSLTLANAAGDAANFNNAAEYIWPIAQTTGITGFDPAAFNINTSAFSNALAGTFSIEQNGNNLQLHYLPGVDLGITNVGTPEPVAAGSTLTYTIIVTNGGPNTATGVTVTNTLSSQVSFTSASAGCTHSMGTVTCNVGTLAPNGTTTLTISGTVTGCPATISSTASASANEFDIFGGNNSSTAMNTVTDTTPPGINCGQNETVTCQQGWGFTVPIVTNDCGTFTLTTNSTTTNFTCGYTYVATRVWQVTDSANNSSYCTQVVSFVDFTPPTITSCPANTNVQCLSNVPAPDPSSVAAMTQAFETVCETNPPTVVHFSDVTNGISPIVITRTYRAYDACSNYANCTQTLTVQDTMGPTLTACPANILAQDPENDGEVVTYTPPTATDCEGAVSVNCAPASGSTFALGTNTVVCSAVDSVGNSNACTFTVAVVLDCGLQAQVYVDDDYANNQNGDMVNFPDNGAPGPHTIGCDAFAAMQGGVDATSPGGTVNVAAGSFPELVIVSTPMTLLGANAGIDPRVNCHVGPVRGAESIIDGMGVETAIKFASSGITLDGFTIQGGCCDAFTSGLHIGGFDNNHVLNNIIRDNSIGIFANCAGPMPTEIRRNLINANNRTGPSGGTGIYVDASANLQILENEFSGHTDNHPLFVAATTAGDNTGLVVTENNFHDNAYGLFVLGVNGGTFSRNQFSLLDGTCLAFFGGSSGIDVLNNIFVSLDSSNTRGVRIRDDGYALGNDIDIEIHGNSFTGFGSTPTTAFAVGIISGYTGTLDASANWWGVATPAGVLAKIDNSGGPVDYTPWLVTGVEPVPDVCNGFQGDFSTLEVDAASPQSTPLLGRVQEGINLVTVGGTVKIVGGTYGPPETADASANSVTLAPGASPAQVIINGDMTLDSNDTLEFELNGTTPGTDYDQFVVNGMVTLGGATFSATAGFAYADCTTLTLIDNDSADPVSGTFAGLPNGATVVISGQSFKIFYNGGDGNDVVLVKDTTAPTITCPANIVVSDTNSPSGSEVVTYTPTVSDNCPGVMTNCVPASGTAFPSGVTMVTCTATDSSSNSAMCSFNVVVCGPTPAITYVDDDYANNQNGDMVNFPDDGNPGPHVVGCDAFATVQGGINAVASAGTVNVAAGNYAQNVTLGKRVNLLGAQNGVDARGRVVGAPSSATESIIAPASGIGLLLQTGVADSVIDGFAFVGGTRSIESSSGPLDRVQIRNNHMVGFTDAAVFLNDPGTDMTIAQNVMQASSKTAGGGTLHLDTDAFLGLHIICNWIQNAPAGPGMFVDGNRNVRPSANRAPLILQNLFANHSSNVGINMGSRAFDSGTISMNTFTNNAFDGLQGGPKDSLIVSNLFVDNLRWGLALTSFGNTSAGRGATNLTITCNTFTRNGLGANTSDGGILFSAAQPANNNSSHRVNYNNISGNSTGAVYTGSEIVNMENNWWGASTGPTHPNNPGGTGDIVFDQVVTGTGPGMIDYTPFLTQDTSFPQIICPTDIVTTNDVGQCSAVVAYPAPTASSPPCCPGSVTVVCNPPSGSAFPVGTNTVTCSATNACGQGATCLFSVIVNDAAAPVIGACPSDIMATNDASQCSAVVNYTAPTATDNCTNVTVTCAPPSGFAFPVGTNTVTCTATDSAGNTNACTFTVTVVDNEAPMIACPANVTVPTDAGTCAATNVNLGTPTTSDNCGVAGVTNDAPAQYPAGMTFVTWNVTDIHGNMNTCTQKVTVVDMEQPQITCPSNVTVSCEQPITPASTGTATATDNCDPNPAISFMDMNASTVTSNSPNGWALSTTDGGTPPDTATAEFVSGPGVPPLGTGSARLAVGTNGNGAAQARSINYNSALLSALTELRYFTYRTQDGSGGQMAYILLNVDLDGNGTTDDLLFFEPEYQKPVYNPTLPDQGPLLTGAWQDWDALAGGWWSLNGLAGLNPGTGVKPLSTYIAANPTARLAVTAAGALRLVAGFGAGAWDNFDGNVDAVSVGTNGVSTTYDFEAAPAGACPNSTIVRTWKATDVSGNMSSCAQFIRVVDTNAPSLTCSPVMVNADPGQCSAVVNYTAPVSDNCDTNPTVVCVPASGTAFPVGTNTVNCTAYDACGNSNTCSFTVTVIDNQPPLVTCSSNIVVECVTPAGTPVTYSSSATDNCGTNVTVTCTPPSGSTFPPGTTTVTCSGIDSRGNSNGCSFTVTVGDTTPPFIPPPTFAAGTDDNFTGPEPASPSAGLAAFLSGNDLKGFDDCSIDHILAHSFTNLPRYIDGATLRIKMRACPGSLSENDTINLVFAEPDGNLLTPKWRRRIGTYSGDGIPGLLPGEWSPGTQQEFVFDLSNLPNADGSFTNLIPTMRAERFLDLYVQDDTDVDYVILTIQNTRCIDDIVVDKDPAQCGTNVTYTTPYMDNCDTNVTVVCTPPSGSFFTVGTNTTVTCTAIDDSGNTNSCTFLVYVNDPTPPVLSIERGIGPTVVISWPVGSPCNYRLEEVPFIPATPAFWTPTPEPVIVMGGRYTVTVPSGSGNKFYRLRYP